VAVARGLLQAGEAVGYKLSKTFRQALPFHRYGSDQILALLPRTEGSFLLQCGLNILPRIPDATGLQRDASASGGALNKELITWWHNCTERGHWWLRNWSPKIQNPPIMIDNSEWTLKRKIKKSWIIETQTNEKLKLWFQK
jgi:hypothetical protein